MLSSLFISQIVNEVGRVLDRTGSGERVLVCEQARFGKALAAAGVPVVQLASKRRSLRRRTGPRVYAYATQLPVADASVSALVGFGLGQRPDWSGLLWEWARAVRSGGHVVMVDRADRAELTRRALCSGLIDIEQSSAGRYVITSGAVVKLPG